MLQLELSQEDLDTIKSCIKSCRGNLNEEIQISVDHIAKLCVVEEVALIESWRADQEDDERTLLRLGSLLRRIEQQT